MNAIKNKIRSREGASISFALLAFLVCAVISSVVIVAGSTAAGRMSQIAQSDQRYYAVNSAAGLLQSTLDGKVVSRIAKTKKTVQYYSTGAEPSDSGPVAVDGYPKFYTVDVSKTETEPETSITDPQSYSILTDAAYILTYEGEPGKTYPNLRHLTLSASATPGEDSEVTAESLSSALAVDIYETLDNSGTLTFYVSKKVTGSDAAYTLRLTFAADITENTASNTVHGTPEPDGTYKDITTVTKTTVIKWTLIDIVKSAVPE